MIMAAIYEDIMQEAERSIGKIIIDPGIEKDTKKMIKDTSKILGQFGYEAGAKILERIFDANE